MKKKSLIVFITHILAFLFVSTILGCSVESSSGEEKTKYTVSYSSDYATEQVYKLKPVTVQEGTVLGVEQLPVLSENGFTFIGWYDGETKVVAGAYKVTKNVTLVAKWTKKTVKDDDSKKTSYTISYFSEKGVTYTSLLNHITVSEGAAITAEQLPELSATGWSFEGWYDGGTKVIAGAYKVTKNVTLVAKWSKKSSQDDDSKTTSYTISYFSDKGVTDASLLNPITLSEDSVITAEHLPKLSADGWNFEGWYDGETKVVVGVYKVTKNVLFIAKWSKSGQTEEEPDKPIVTYTVSYSSDKGVTDAELLNPITISEGTAITAEQLPELSATGWSFEGWYDGETKVIAGYKVTKNITLVAKWTLNPKYTVEHWLQNIDDDDYVCKKSDSQQLYGKTGDMTNATAKNYPGFTAQEIEQRVIQPDGTTVVIIKYDRKIITVTVNLDGGKIDGKENNITAKGKFGAKTELKVKNPKKTDCEFGGWSMDIPETFPADDIEIKALWGKYYRVSYQSEKPIDFTPETIFYVEGEVLTYLPELSETGWIFEGWYDGETKAISGEYVITKDVTLVAKWSPATVTYTVEHCQQNIENDEYTFLVITEQLSGKTEELTAALAKDYPGFTAQNITQSKIAADGSTVVKIYYDRKTINLTFNLDGGNIDGNLEDVVVSGKYGANVSVPEPIKADCKFIGWDKTIPQTFPAENDVFVAHWKGTASITINLFDWDSDLKIIKETERFYNVVVPESYTDISYYINNEKQSETSNNYKFIIPERVGCYNLFIKAKKNGLWYSYSLNAVVSISED